MRREGIVYFPLWMVVLGNIRSEETIMSSLSVNLKVTFSNISQIVKHLEERGFLKKKNLDKRTKVLILTKKGEKMSNMINKLIEEEKCKQNII